ncbi:hypothetical protein D3C87_1432450 [compost metagenome]
MFIRSEYAICFYIDAIEFTESGEVHGLITCKISLDHIHHTTDFHTHLLCFIFIDLQFKLREICTECGICKLYTGLLHDVSNHLIGHLF